VIARTLHSTLHGAEYGQLDPTGVCGWTLTILFFSLLDTCSWDARFGHFKDMRELDLFSSSFAIWRDVNGTLLSIPLNVSELNSLTSEKSEKEIFGSKAFWGQYLDFISLGESKRLSLLHNKCIPELGIRVPFHRRPDDCLKGNKLDEWDLRRVALLNRSSLRISKLLSRII